MGNRHAARLAGKNKSDVIDAMLSRADEFFALAPMRVPVPDPPGEPGRQLKQPDPTEVQPLVDLQAQLAAVKPERAHAEAIFLLTVLRSRSRLD